MNSYEKINYKLRPQKRIERALFARFINDAATLIGKKFNYIGMGSLYFTDFNYFNRNCSVNRMISIESMKDKNGKIDSKKHHRFHRNKPFDSIKIIPEFTTQAIDKLPLSENNFIWFDYDGGFDEYMLVDLTKIIKGSTESSIIAISFNGYIPKSYISNREVNIDKLINTFLKYSTFELKSNMFSKDEYYKTCIEICKTYLEEVVKEKNQINTEEYILNFISKVEYQDGAKMITLIWSYIKSSETNSDQIIEGLNNSELAGNIDLSMDMLTLYEKQILDRRILKDISETSRLMGIDEETIIKYYKYSKYIPEYSEVYV